MPKLREPKAKPEANEDDEVLLVNQEQDGEIPHPQEAPRFNGQEEDKGKEKTVDKSPDEASLALQKQIEALKKSEEMYRARAEQYQQEREEALQRAQAQETEVAKFRNESVRSQYDAVSTALAAAQNEAESAKRDIKSAIANADADAQTEAYERLATARANITKLEDGKFELEAAIKSPPQEQRQPQRPPTIDEAIDNMKVPRVAKDWLRQNPQYLTNPRLNLKIQNWHHEAIEAGNEEFDAGYMRYINEKAGLIEPENDNESESRRAPIVSAPVSREPPSTTTSQRGGVIRLTAAQREMAKVAGISETEYAKQLQKLNSMKDQGMYGERR